MHDRILDCSDADAMTSHVDYPDYRVDFWEKVGPPPVGKVTQAHGVSNHLLSEVDDVQQALDWATNNAAGRSFVLFALVSAREGKPALPIRLFGSDPTQHDSRRP
jgi:hypothetical protein